jgi:hypothetical protein
MTVQELYEYIVEQMNQGKGHYRVTLVDQDDSIDCPYSVGIDDAHEEFMLSYIS